MIRKTIIAAAALLASLSLAAAPAAASSLTVKDGNSATQAIGTTTRPSDSALLYNMDTVVAGASTDIGSAVVANTALTLQASAATRRGWSFQNQTTGSCYINFLATATADYHSLLVPAGLSAESKDSHVNTGAFSVLCAISGSVYARAW